MSRVMEIVTSDAPDVVSRRVYLAFRRIGRVQEYDPQEFVEGKIYVGATPAFVTVEWSPYRDGQRMRVDISATSGDELSRAADSAMYRFAEAFKAVTPEEASKPLKHGPPAGVWVTLGLVAAGALAYFLRAPLLSAIP